MRREVTLEEISDGKLYDIEDIVKADTCGCDGCSDCCHDVGELVVLTPFDIYEMVNYLGVEFDELLGDKIELRQNNKILSEWESLSNAQLETGKYVDLFMTSDAMIHDCGSFTIEYHYTLKPVMYLVKGEEHTKMMILNTFYR